MGGVFFGLVGWLVCCFCEVLWSCCHVSMLLFVLFCSELFLFALACVVAWLVGFAHLSATCHNVMAVSNLFVNLRLCVCVCSSSFGE